MISRTQIISRPAHSPMDLNAGEPSPKAALFTSGLTLLFMILAALGAWLGYLFAPEYGEWTFVRVVGASLGTLMALFSLLQTRLYTKITWLGWTKYYERLADWHDTMLDAYQVNDGQETYTETNLYALTCDMPHHVLVTALVIHHRLNSGASTRQLPYSRRGLEEPLYLGIGGSNLVRMGELLGTMPERMGSKLATLGLISGRSNNTAGEWIPQSEREVIEIFVRNWHRIESRSVHDDDY